MSRLVPFLATFVLAIAAFDASTALAFHVSEQSLQARLQRSDLVVVVLIEKISGDKPLDRIAVAKTISVVKGTAPPRVEFYISSNIAEWQLNCCVVGRKYLLFLKRTGSGRYDVVNSKFGAYPLEREKTEQ